MGGVHLVFNTNIHSYCYDTYITCGYYQTNIHQGSNSGILSTQLQTNTYNILITPSKIPTPPVDDFGKASYSGGVNFLMDLPSV